MKKITILSLLMTFALCAMAQKAQIQHKSMETKSLVTATPMTKQVKVKDAATLRQKAPRKATGDVLVTLPTGVTAEAWAVTNVSWTYGQTGSNNPESMNVAIDGNDIYLQGTAYYFPEAWIKGTITGDKAVFPSGQYVGSDSYGDTYMIGGDIDANYDITITDIVFSYDATAGALSLDNYIFENESKDEVGYWAYISILDLSSDYVAPEVVTPPADLEVTPYIFTAQDYNYSENTYTPVEFTVNVGFDGSDVYIQGLGTDWYLPNAWVKGTINGSTITLPTGQYLGAALGSYSMYLLGYGEPGIVDATLTVNSDGTITTDNWLIINAYKSSISYYAIYTNVVLTDAAAFAPAVPANPENLEWNYSESYGYYLDFDVPSVDVDGNPLNINSLSYGIYYDINGTVAPYTLEAEDFEYLDEDMTLIPYTFTDDWDIYAMGNEHEVYLNSGDPGTWNRVGVKSFYTVNDVTNESEIVWYVIKEATTVGDVTGEGTVDVADVNAVINIILKNKTAADYPGNADVTGEGDVDVADVNAIINIILRGNN